MLKATIISILTDTVHGCTHCSGVTYVYFMKQDFSGLRILKQPTAAILLYVFDDKQFFSVPQLISFSQNFEVVIQAHLAFRKNKNIKHAHLVFRKNILDNFSKELEVKLLQSIKTVVSHPKKPSSYH